MYSSPQSTTENSSKHQILLQNKSLELLKCVYYLQSGLDDLKMLLRIVKS